MALVDLQLPVSPYMPFMPDNVLFKTKSEYIFVSILSVKCSVNDTSVDQLSASTCPTTKKINSWHV